MIGYENPGSGGAITPITQTSAYNDRLVDVRRGHVEDWIPIVSRYSFHTGELADMVQGRQVSP